jgi:hypothetical protein
MPSLATGVHCHGRRTWVGEAPTHQMGRQWRRILEVFFSKSDPTHASILVCLTGNWLHCLLSVVCLSFCIASVMLGTCCSRPFEPSSSLGEVIALSRYPQPPHRTAVDACSDIDLRNGPFCVARSSSRWLSLRFVYHQPRCRRPRFRLHNLEIP